MTELEQKLNFAANSLQTNIFEVSNNTNGLTDAKVNTISSEVALIRARLYEMNQ